MATEARQREPRNDDRLSPRKRPSGAVCDQVGEAAQPHGPTERFTARAGAGDVRLFEAVAGRTALPEAQHADLLLHLQATLGNAAVGRVVAGALSSRNAPVQLQGSTAPAEPAQAPTAAQQELPAAPEERARALFRQGVAATDAGDYRLAMERFGAVLEIPGMSELRNSVAWLNLAIVAQAAGDRERALSA